MRLKNKRLHKTSVFIIALAISILLTATGVGATSISVNGTPTALNAVNLDGTVMVPLRAAAGIILPQSTVNWNQASRQASVSTSNLSLNARIGLCYIEANERYLGSPCDVALWDDTTYVPIRTLTEAFGGSIGWDANSQTVYVTTGSGYIPHGNTEYYEGDVYWLSRIIHAESGIEPMRGKIAVGNVVLNRIASSEFPNTIYEVIFDKKYGVQFSPVANGTIYNTPSTDSVIAAKIAIDGYSQSTKVLYFCDPVISSSQWIQNNRKFAFRIGSHYFYE